MKLQSFTFHPHAILVDGHPLHGVRVGDSDVTEISLLEGVLIVSRGTTVWFTHTSYGTGVPVVIDTNPAWPTDSDPQKLNQDLEMVGVKVTDLDPWFEPRASQPVTRTTEFGSTKKQRSKKQ